MDMPDSWVQEKNLEFGKKILEFRKKIRVFTVNLPHCLEFRSPWLSFAKIGEQKSFGVNIWPNLLSIRLHKHFVFLSISSTISNISLLLLEASISSPSVAIDGVLLCCFAILMRTLMQLTTSLRTLRMADRVSSDIWSRSDWLHQALLFFWGDFKSFSILKQNITLHFSNEETMKNQ